VLRSYSFEVLMMSAVKIAQLLYIERSSSEKMRCEVLLLTLKMPTHLFADHQGECRWRKNEVLALEIPIA